MRARPQIAVTVARNSFTTHFELEELWVTGDALGQRAEFTRDGFDVVLRLPASNDEFANAHVSSPGGRGSFGYSASSKADGADSVQTVRVIQLTLERDTDFGATTAVERMDDVRDFITRATSLARTIAREFVQWARVRRGQNWLGMSHHEPPIVGIRALHDETAGQDIRIGFSDGVVLRPLPRDKAIDPLLVSELPVLLSDAHPSIPVADALIADASYLMGIRPPNPEQAVLLAAVGLEVAVKLALRAKVDDARRDLLDYILDHPRDVSQQAVALFDATMDVAINRSLKTEDKPLFKRVDRLFQQRNAVAHGGVRVPPSDALDSTRAAQEALVWLASL